MKKKKVCKLNVKENKFWEDSFSYHLDHGLSPSKADKKAFTDLKKEFPRFKKCDKIK